MDRETQQRKRKGGKHLSPAGWKPSLLTWAIILVALGTLIAGLYTPAASWVSSYNQAGVVESYAKAVDAAEPDAKAQLELAHRYNDALTYGVVVEAGENVPQGSAEADQAGLDYWEMLTANEEGLMGRIRIPEIDVDLPFYHGTSEDVLERSAGHLQGSHLPVGGVGTRAVVTAHRGLAESVLFTHLDEVSLGDRFTFEVFGDVLTYVVVDVNVVEPEDTDVIRADPDRDLATLITCTPLGLNTHRIIVTGERVLPTPQEDLDGAGGPSDLPRFPWWALILVAGLAAISWYLVRQGRKDAAPSANEKPRRDSTPDQRES